MNCAICEKDLRETGLRWTDTNGIAACQDCGATYEVLGFKDEDDKHKVLHEEPKLMIQKKYVALLKKYWQESKRNCDTGAFNFPGSSYEVATSEDFETYNKWMSEHKPEWELIENQDEQQ